MLRFDPEAALNEFQENIGLFASELKEEFILYKTCIENAIYITDREQDPSYLKEALAQCSLWSKDIPLDKQDEIRKEIQGVAAMYYRNTGDYQQSIVLFESVIKSTNDIHYKLYSLSQIASILYMMHDKERLGLLFKKCNDLINDFIEPEENIAELFDIYGFYYKMLGRYEDAQVMIQRAISISTSLFGEQADTTMKFKYNMMQLKFNMGYMHEVNEQMEKMYTIVLDDPEQYQESIPVLLNLSITMSITGIFNNDMLDRIRVVLDRKQNIFDILSNIVFKSNHYYMLMACHHNDHSPAEELKKELQAYFARYPGSEGYLQYLQAEVIRLSDENKHHRRYEVLKEIEDYLTLETPSFHSKQYFISFLVKLYNRIYEKDYGTARKWLLSLWNMVMFPLFDLLYRENKKDGESFLELLHSYISLFISLVIDYPQLRINNKTMYEYILNFKILEDICNSRNNRFNSVLTENWVSLDSVKISADKLIIDPLLSKI